ncbi:MAG TPA: endonuclease V [Actinomycetota bacterium]|nr:endonuclease V [Actinomycetota bacterium]
MILAEWTAERPAQEFAPVAATARIARLAQVLEQRFERITARFGLDWGQFLVLAALRGSGKPFQLSPRELHRLLLLSPAAMTNRLYRLEAKGLIERTANPIDRRSVPVVLTPAGRSVVERAMAACLEEERALLSVVEPTDLQAALRVIRQLLTAYDDYPSRPSWRLRLALAGAEASPPPAPTPADELTRWPESNRELERLQRKLARRADEVEPWEWRGTGHPAVGGVFVSLPTGRNLEHFQDFVWAAAVVMEGGNLTATATATRRLRRPYQPGYLALTVGPILEEVVRALSQRPDIIVVNAAGRDHPRGAGLAIQLGAALDIPTVGVTERPIVGTADEPGSGRGEWRPLRVGRRLVGFRVRTLSRCAAITVHAAWRTTPEVARDIVMSTTGRWRFPEPLHRARQLSRQLRSEYAQQPLGGGLQDGIHR